MKVFWLIAGVVLFLFVAGCVQPMDDYNNPTLNTSSLTENPSGNVPSFRDTFFYFFSGEDNPADYTSFCPPSYIPPGYTPYDLNIYTVWNETEPNDHRTTVCERLRYGLNITPHASWTPDMTLLEISWSEYGFDPYENDRNEIIIEEPKIIAVGDYNGQLYDNGNFRLIVWIADNATYSVYGSLDSEDLLKVGSSIDC
ncbi:MAG: DUF4367 domain-containing protein [Methanomicrobium sp.]|nr:DUF4367 domain-containing protein [Methanomicrobium sp.]